MTIQSDDRVVSSAWAAEITCSRRAIMAAAIVAALVPPAFHPARARPRLPGLEGRKMMAVPPALAVAAAVFSIASSLKSLFGSRESPSGIKRRLDEIIAQNRQILQTLGEIVTILNNMGVVVRENVRFEMIFDKQSALIGESRQLFEAWSAELVDSRARRQAAQRYQNDILPDIRDTTRQLMEPGYGFTAADTVGAGMMMEFWMSQRLGERRSYRREIGATFAGYFNRSLDATADGTPAKALAEAVAQRDRLKPILDAADERIGPSGWTAETHRAVRHRTISSRSTEYTRFRILETATGNQSTGYSVASREEILRRWVETEPREGDCHGPRCLKANFGADPARGDPPDTSGPSPTGRVTYWSAVRTAYLAAVADVELLTRVNDTLRFYRDEAEGVRMNG